MSVLIICDNQVIASKLRHAAVQAGHPCGGGDVVRVDDAAAAVTKRYAAHASAPWALLVFVLPDALRHGLEVLEQVASQAAPYTIVVGPPHNAELILQAVRHGANDYFDETLNFVDQLMTTARRLRAHAAPGSGQGRLISIAAAGGGTGCSVVAGNLAASLALNGRDCTLLDLDQRAGAQALLLDLKARHSLTDLLRNVETVDQDMFEKTLVRHSSGLRLLAAPSGIEASEPRPPAAINKLLRLARGTAGCVIADVGADAPGNAPILHTSDRIAVVFRLDITSVRNTQELLERWQLEGVDQDKVRLVANRAGQCHALDAERAQTALGRKVDYVVPEDAATVNLSVNCGVPAVIEASLSKLGKSLGRCAAAMAEDLWPSAASAAPAAVRPPITARLWTYMHDCWSSDLAEQRTSVAHS